MRAYDNSKSVAIVPRNRSVLLKVKADGFGAVDAGCFDGG